MDYLIIIFSTVIYLFLPGASLLSLFRFRNVAYKGILEVSFFFLPLSFALSVSVISVLGWVGYALNWGFYNVRVGVPAITIVFILISAWLDWPNIVRKSNFRNYSLKLLSPNFKIFFKDENNPSVPSIKYFVPKSLIIWLLAITALILSIYGGTWLSHTADTFGHLSAIRSVIQYNNPLPQEILFPVPVKEMSPIFGTWNLSMALVAAIAQVDLVLVWNFINILLAPILLLAFASFAYTLSRRLDAAFLSTLLYFVLQQKLDFRTLAYPNKAGQVLLWLAIVYAIRYSQVKSIESDDTTGAEKNRFSNIVILTLLSFGVSAIHMQYAPVLMLLLGLGVIVSFVDNHWDTFLFRTRLNLPFSWFSMKNHGTFGQANKTARQLAGQDVSKWIVESIKNLLSWRLLQCTIVVIVAALIPFGIKTLQMLSSPRVKITETAASEIDALDLSLWFSSFSSELPLLITFAIGMLVIWRRHDNGVSFLIGAGLSVPLFVGISHLFVGVGGTWNTLIERLLRLVPAILFIGLGWSVALSIKLIQKNMEKRRYPFRVAVAMGVLISSSILAFQSFEGVKNLYSSNSTYKYRLAINKNNDLYKRWADALAVFKALPNNSIILSDLSTSYMINGLTGLRNVSQLQQHTSLWDKDVNNIGIFDVRNFTSGSLDRAQEMDVLQKHRVTHVFVSKEQTPAMWSHLQSIAALTLIAEGSDWRLYEFHPYVVDTYLGFHRQREKASNFEELVRLYRNYAELFPNKEQFKEAAAVDLDIPEEFILSLLSLGDLYQSPIEPGLYFDFLSNYEPAGLSDTGGSSNTQRTVFIFERLPRGILFSHPPSELTYQVQIPPKASLQFSPVFDPSTWQLGKGDGVLFQIFLETEDGAQYTLYNRYYDPKNIPSQRTWIEEKVDLGSWADQTVKITFVTDPGPNQDARFDWAGWGEPRIVQPVEYDFLENFSSATSMHGEFGQVYSGTQTIDYETRPFLFQHPTSRTTYSLSLPTRSTLAFGFGMSPEVWSPDKGDGVEYNIYVKSLQEPNRLVQVFHRYIDAKNNPDDRRWFDERVDLSRFGGQAVEIIFECLPGPQSDASFDWGGWSSPVLIDETDPGLLGAQSLHAVP